MVNKALELPVESRVVHFSYHNDLFHIYIEVPSNIETEKHEYFTSVYAEPYTYIKTLIYDDYVWHLYRIENDTTRA